MALGSLPGLGFEDHHQCSLEADQTTHPGLHSVPSWSHVQKGGKVEHHLGIPMLGAGMRIHKF